ASVGSAAAAAAVSSDLDTCVPSVVSGAEATVISPPIRTGRSLHVTLNAPVLLTGSGPPHTTGRPVRGPAPRPTGRPRRPRGLLRCNSDPACRVPGTVVAAA